MILASPHHAAALAAIHEAAFPPGERWTVRAMAGLLATPSTVGFIDPRGGCALARLAGGEAELLTLAVAPAARRQGIARGLLRRVIEAAAGAPLFLEVAAANAAALALYEQSGLRQCGRRSDYYGPDRHALVLRLTPPGAAPPAS